MIISHRHKYIFTELPLTASSAIAKELIENYEGESFSRKHLIYSNFLKQAKPEEKEYFVFSSIRNPLDQAVSHYFKYKTDHNGRFSNMRKKKKERKYAGYFINRYRHVERFNYIKENDASFQDFFLKFYQSQYSNWSIMDHKKMDYIIRYENIQQDFERTLEKLNIEKKGDLPYHNKTESKSKHFLEYYDTKEMQQRAYSVFYWFMNDWNYDFPVDWKINETPPSKLAYDFVNLIKKRYWSYFH